MKSSKRGKNLQLTALLLTLALSACGNDAGGAGTGAGASAVQASGEDSVSTAPISPASGDIPAAQGGALEEGIIPDAQGTEEGGAASDAQEETGESGSATDSGTEPDPVSTPPRGTLPEGFVYLDEQIPDALFEIRYASDYNFVGAVVDGYKAPVAIATEEMARALLKVNEELKQSGYVLLIYDAYRPKKAVAHFARWAADVEDTAMKDAFYPNVDKSQVFKLGYVASKSGHSRGSTVDLTIAEMDTGLPLDMGGPYDFFGDISAHGTKEITAEQTANRELLKNAMVRYGFKPYNKEWWHYTLKDEPYPKKYFDFDVE